MSGHSASTRQAISSVGKWVRIAGVMASSSQGELTNINPPGALNASLLDINPQQHMIGRYQQPAGVFHMFLFADGAFTSLDVPGALSNGGMGARASINPKREVVSANTGADGRIRGVLVEHGAVVWTMSFPTRSSPSQPD